MAKTLRRVPPAIAAPLIRRLATIAVGRHPGWNDRPGARWFAWHNEAGRAGAARRPPWVMSSAGAMRVDLG